MDYLIPSLLKVRLWRDTDMCMPFRCIFLVPTTAMKRKYSLVYKLLMFRQELTDYFKGCLKFIIGSVLFLLALYNNKMRSRCPRIIDNSDWFCSVIICDHFCCGCMHSYRYWFEVWSSELSNNKAFSYILENFPVGGVVTCVSDVHKEILSQRKSEI